MDYSEVLENARKRMAPKCKVCPVCDGLGCGHTMPGPGSKGPGNGANDNYMAWRQVKLNIDTIVANTAIDTTTEFFGRKLAFPLVTGPIGSIAMQFDPADDVRDFNAQCMAACETRGLLHFYSTGLSADVQTANIASRLRYDNCGIPIINPEADDEILRQMAAENAARLPLAMGVVVDSAGLPHLKALHGDAGTKSVEQLRLLKEKAGVPFIVKGVMTAASALKAVDAGADALIVSNHGGRVLSDTPATAEVLAEIADAVAGRATIIVDGQQTDEEALVAGNIVQVTGNGIMLESYPGQYPGITKVEVIETGSPADAEQYADIVDTVFAAPDQSQVPVGSLSYKTDQADTSVVLNPYEFDWQWQTEDGQTSTSQVDGSAADGNGTLNETIVDARIPNPIDAFIAFSVNPTSLEIERQPLVKGETAKIDPQSDGEDVPCTLGDDGTAALRIEPNYLYEVKATFPQGEAEYAFYTID